MRKIVRARAAGCAMQMKAMKEWRLGLLVPAFLLFFVLGAITRYSTPQTVRQAKYDCSPYFQLPPAPLQGELGGPDPPNSHSPLAARPRFLSYQPPGNGWNNQRIALENALVLAKLLDRTLVLHPLAPHGLGTQLKAGRRPGYVAYNMLGARDLLQLDQFLDLSLMSQLQPVVAVNITHPQFLSDYAHLSWKNVCHSSGFGYWLDQPPATAQEVALLARQTFIPNKVWQDKCPEEQRQAKHLETPIVRYVSDLKEETEEMLYFEQGTLFSIHIRFTTLAAALQAQNWVLNYVDYGARVWNTVNLIVQQLGQFNAIQVRRRDHVDRKLTPAYWLDRMLALNFSTRLPLYIATDYYEEHWFKPFHEHSFKVYTASSFSALLDFSHLTATLQADYLAIHEQCICEKAHKFIPSPASTYAAYILRRRGEVAWRDGLMQSTLHTYWIGHQAQGR